MPKKTNPKQTERIQFIDFCANYLGKIGRVDIVERFGISDAAASKDIAEYINLAPNNLSYDFKSKTHKPTEDFKPLFEFPVPQVLQFLITGNIYLDERIKKPLLKSIDSLELVNPNLDIVAQITRAISRKKIVAVTYWSLTSGQSQRKLAPFAIVNSGLRWHIRSFCRKRNQFRDFTIARIEKAKLTEENIQPHEKEDHDVNWNRIVNLELIPHPTNVKYPEAIMMDYGMKNGVLKIEERFAVVGYILRHWNIDCTSDHSLKNRNFQLWLRNRDSIEGIEELVMAPGINQEL